jgi:hypothetical protein
LYVGGDWKIKDNKNRTPVEFAEENEEKLKKTKAYLKKFKKKKEIMYNIDIYGNFKEEGLENTPNPILASPSSSAQECHVNISQNNNDTPEDSTTIVSVSDDVITRPLTKLKKSKTDKALELLQSGGFKYFGRIKKNRGIFSLWSTMAVLLMYLVGMGYTFHKFRKIIYIYLYLYIYIYICVCIYIYIFSYFPLFFIFTGVYYALTYFPKYEISYSLFHFIIFFSSIFLWLFLCVSNPGRLPMWRGETPANGGVVKGLWDFLRFTRNLDDTQRLLYFFVCLFICLFVCLFFFFCLLVYFYVYYLFYFFFFLFLNMCCQYSSF